MTILIGAGFPNLILHSEIRHGKDTEPYALKTKLGWVLLGGKKNKKKINSNFINASFDLEKFWEIDSYGTLPKHDVKLMTKDEKLAYDILDKTTVFKDEHYETGLLWRDKATYLENNRMYALKRLINLENRLKKSPKVYEKYVLIIKEYTSLGHAR